jgi:hypothetical protein
LEITNATFIEPLAGGLRGFGAAANPDDF